MNKITSFIITTLLLSCWLADLSAQEVIIPLSVNQAAREYYRKNESFTKSATDITLELPVTDDFSNYTIEPDQKIWSDRYAFINHAYSVNPITFGVATLDAIDFDGSIYPHAVLDPNTFIADYLTSHPINLNYPASDSLYMSFFYQPQGMGELPEEQDSLSVQFYDPSEEKWITVWQIPGDTLHDFKLVMLPITESRYLADGFRFRFKNLASLSRNNDFPDFRGNVDHWNIDYVKLDRLRSQVDTIHRDVAFIQQVPSILKNLESIPWKHFEPAYNTILSPILSVRYRNNDTITRNVTRKLVIKDMLYDVTVEPGQPTAQDLPPNEDTVVNFGYIYPFDFEQGDIGMFKFTASLRTDVFDNKNNDTVSRIQAFKDYYAYDDGTAEYGYGIRGQGSKLGKVAVKYNIYKPDQIEGLDLHFNQLYDSLNLGYYFKLAVWNDNEGKPGSLLYEDDKYHTPLYSQSLNGFIRYKFSEPVPVSGVVYFGWIQTSEYLLNIGLDVNKRPSPTALFYNKGDGWISSNAPGIIMLRPFIKSLITNRQQQSINRQLKIYPNPAIDIIHLDYPSPFSENKASVEIFDLNGRLILNKQLEENKLNISFLENGLYFIRVNRGNEIFNSKLLINR